MLPVVLTRHGVLRGMRMCVPLLIGLTPFGLVCGIVSQGAGLSLAECELMSAVVYGGSAQLVALASWSHPAPVVAATLAAAVAVGCNLLLPGTSWYIVAGALAGSLVGGLRDLRRQ
jgi:predicted branched-subunit amino acid permease